LFALLAAVTLWRYGISSHIVGSGPPQTGFWAAWWSGKDTHDFKCFWIPVYFWHRIAKVLLFIAGLSIVIDILGPDGLRRLAASFSARPLFEKALELFRDSVRYVRAINRATYTKVSEAEADALSKEAFRYIFGPLNLVVTVTLSFVVLNLAHRFTLPGKIGITLLLLAIAPAVILAVSLFAAVPGAIIDWMLLRPAAAILEKEGSEKSIRILMLISLVVGAVIEIVTS
jgi:hypothetical protein